MMYRNCLHWLLIPLLLSGMIYGCGEGDQKPENLIPEDKYINLLVELQLLESYRISAASDSSNIDSLKRVIYEQYSIDEQQFVASHRFYQRQIQPQKQRIVQAIDRLRERMLEEGLTDSTAILRSDGYSSDQ